MKQKLYITVALLVVLLVVANLLAGEFHLRFDFTDEKQYSLSQATQDILDELEEPVTVSAYFSENLPPHVAKTRRDFQEMLIEYASMTNGMLLYEFIDPSESEDIENDAVSHGVRPVLINVREKNEVKQQKAFLGATVSMGDEMEVIPFMQPGTAMEYALSTAIKKISVKNKSLIGFLQGHGEPPLTEMTQVKNQLEVLYNVIEVNVDTVAIPPSVKTLVIVRPKDSIPTSVFTQIDELLTRGGRVAVAINRVEGNLQQSYGSSVDTGLEVWLATKGIEVASDFVADAICGSVTVQQQQGFFTMQSNVSFPYLPRIVGFVDHPITKGLEGVIFEFASSIRYVGDSTSQFTPIVLTSDKANKSPTPLYFDIQKQWQNSDFLEGNIPLAATLEGGLGNDAAKIAIVSDGDFAINGPPERPRNLQPDNINLLCNMIDWLSDDTGLIELRTKGVTSRPIDAVDDSTKTMLKYANFLSPIFLVILYGILRAQRNKMKKLRRASENYEDI